MPGTVAGRSTEAMIKSERVTRELTLATVETGASVDVLEIRVDDPSSLLVHGIRRGTRLAIDGDAPFGGPRIVRIGDSRVAIDRRLARGILVTRAGQGTSGTERTPAP